MNIKSLLILKLLYAGIWIYLAGYFLFTGGHETAGLKTWLLFVTFTAVSVAGYTRLQKQRQKWAFLLLCITFLLTLPTFIAFWYHGKCSQTIRLGKQIQEQCMRNGRCPSDIDGWEKVSDKHYRNKQLHYNPGNFTDDPRIFRLYYHFGPDFDCWVYGGVGRTLSSKY